MSGLFLMAADPNECTIHIVTDDGSSEGEGEGEGQGQGDACVVDRDCADGQVCHRDQVCTPCDDASAGQACPDHCILNDTGTCIDAPDASNGGDGGGGGGGGNVCTILCSPDTHCVNNQCIPNDSCTSDADCGAHRVCLIDPTSSNGTDSGVCVTQDPPPPPPVCTILCSPDTHCVNDQCIPNDSCTTDADCGQNRRCLHDPSSTSDANDGVCVTQDPAP
ncbi:MAG TPA: hypothetical protein VGO62_13645 [Myxococcota bacterium]